MVIVGGPNRRPTIPRWRTAAILKKKLNSHISATVWPILMKFGTVMHIGSLRWTVHKNRIFENPRRRWPPSWKSQKLRYLRTFSPIFTKFGMALSMGEGNFWPPSPRSQIVKKLNFKNPRRRTAAILTTSSAIAEGPHDASCQLKSCQSRNSAETTCTTSPEQIEVMKLEG